MQNKEGREELCIRFFYFSLNSNTELCKKWWNLTSDINDCWGYTTVNANKHMWDAVLTQSVRKLRKFQRQHLLIPHLTTMKTKKLQQVQMHSECVQNFMCVPSFLLHVDWQNETKHLLAEYKKRIAFFCFIENSFCSNQPQEIYLPQSWQVNGKNYMMSELWSFLTIRRKAERRICPSLLVHALSSL